MSEDLQAQCDSQKKQIEMFNQQLQGAGAQIQSMKQMLAEQLDTIMVVRTNFTLVQQAHQVAVSQLDGANKRIEVLNKEYEALAVEISELKNPPAPLPVEEVEEQARCEAVSSDT